MYAGRRVWTRVRCSVHNAISDMIWKWVCYFLPIYKMSHLAALIEWKYMRIPNPRSHTHTHTFAFSAESFHDWSWFGPIHVCVCVWYVWFSFPFTHSNRFNLLLWLNFMQPYFPLLPFGAFSVGLFCFAVGTFNRFHSIYIFLFSYLQCSIKSILDQGCFRLFILVGCLA